MMRFTTSVIFLVAFAVQTFYTGGLVADYYLNTAQYLKNCVNKAKPVLKCSGKCQLSKKIQKEQEKEKTAPERKSENKIELLCFKSYFATVDMHDNIVAIPPLTRAEYNVRTGHLRIVLQPPCLV